MTDPTGLKITLSFGQQAFLLGVADPDRYPFRITLTPKALGSNVKHLSGRDMTPEEVLTSGQQTLDAILGLADCKRRIGCKEPIPPIPLIAITPLVGTDDVEIRLTDAGTNLISQLKARLAREQAFAKADPQ